MPVGSAYRNDENWGILSVRRRPHRGREFEWRDGRRQEGKEGGSEVSEDFVTMTAPDAADLLAPDGSEIRLLPRLERGSMVLCTLPPGQVSLAVTHQTVEELWYVVEGQGELWRRRDDHAEVTDLRPGIAVTIPLGTHFQFRAATSGSLRVVIVTMPTWPGDGEAVPVSGRWALDSIRALTRGCPPVA